VKRATRLTLVLLASLAAFPAAAEIYPARAVNRVNAEIVKALKAPDTRQRVLELGADPVGSTPAELASYMKAEIAKWAKVIRSAGIKAD
jgi:tripartite-type tricarboxylate transporter receptor subunit TctC